MEYLGLRAHSREALEVCVSDVLRASGFHGQGVSNTVTGPQRDNGFGQTTVLRGGLLEEHDMRRLFAGKELLEYSTLRQASEQAELKESERQSSDAVLPSTLKCS
jgi:hypothetical protein